MEPEQEVFKTGLKLEIIQIVTREPLGQDMANLKIPTVTRECPEWAKEPESIRFQLVSE
jgi:hypothetical protein